MRIKWTYSISLLITLLLTLGCSRESWEPNNSRQEPTPPAREEKYFVLELQAPSLMHSSATNRAMTAEDEQKIEDLQVLVFKKGSDSEEQNETFLYRANVISQEIDNATGTTKIKITLRTSTTDQYRLVLLGNHPGTMPSLSEGETKSAVFEKIVNTFPDKWDATAGSATLPMWGESNLTTIIDESTTFTDFSGAPAIRMIRSLARVDVGIMFEANAQSESVQASDIPFQIKSVSVYRTATRYRTPGSQGSLGTTPIVPAGTAYRAENNPIRYELTEAGSSYIREIYIPERAAGNTISDAPCLIIGGYYGEGNTSEITYYRADFAQGSSYLPILRNHRYRFNITKVSGPGFSSEEEALDSKPVNIQYTVIKWDEADVSALVTDGQYMMGVSSDRLTFYKTHDSQVITIRTDWASGWTAEVTEGSEWLTLDKTSGSADTDTGIPLTISTSDNDSATQRTGSILIKAGRMQWSVAVTQLSDDHLDVQVLMSDGVTPLSLIDFDFRASDSTFYVKYSPSTTDLILNGPIGDDFLLEVLEEQPGLKKYKVSAGAIDLENEEHFEQRSDLLQFSVIKEGSSASQKLAISQVEYAIIPYFDADLTQDIENSKKIILLDGEEHSIYIQANLPYEIELLSNEADPEARGTGTLIQDAQLRGLTYGNLKGEKIDFTTEDDLTDPKRYLGRAKIRAYSKRKGSDGTTPLVERIFEIPLYSGILQPEANCYLMKPGKAGIIIPVSIINSAKDYYDGNADQLRDNAGSYDLKPEDWANRIALPGISDSEDWTVELLWSDMEPPGVEPENPNGTTSFKMIKKLGNGATGRILILPGDLSKEGDKSRKNGNALICCKDSNGTILWSWHIWMVDEYPMKGHMTSPTASLNRWLDRNIGANWVATDFGDTNTETYGTQYQFGRKDPFPIPGDDYRDLVDKNGRKVTITSDPNRLSMKESIQNPTHTVDNGFHWLFDMGRGSATGPDNYTGRQTNKGQRIWYNLWHGGNRDNGIDNTTGDAAWNQENVTVKTCFDPSPYGWKVPALGKESAWKPFTTGAALISLPRTGTFYYDGDGYNATTYYGLSTVWSGATSATGWRYSAARSVTINSNSTNLETGNVYSRTMGRVIRPVFNSEEADYANFLP
ncbi:MAG: fimbrial protein [Porphyromonas sp.]|nr:fimbrial protein [Porphyromonas sp.]